MMHPMAYTESGLKEEVRAIMHIRSIRQACDEVPLLMRLFYPKRKVMEWIKKRQKEIYTEMETRL